MKIFEFNARGQIMTVIVDDEDAYLLEAYKWVIQTGYKTFYLCRKLPDSPEGKHKTSLLHHEIVGKPAKGCHIDHINLNGLDNRRCNLRHATHSQNLANLGIDKNNTSGFKGVHFCKQTGKWRAVVHFDNKAKRLGRFENKEDAARAYDAAALEIFGEFARTNFGAIARANQ